MELKEALEKITPQDYNKYLALIEVQDTYLKRLECSSQNRIMTGESDVKFKENIGSMSVVEDRASIETNYLIQVGSTETPEFSVNVTYILTYKLQGDLPEAFYTIFKAYTVPLQSFPYVRELVHSMTTRMGFPALILPLRKVLSEKTETQLQKT